MKLALDAGTGGAGHLYSGWMQSLPKIGVVLGDCPVKVMMVDEFADRLASVRNKNAGISTAAIGEGLRTLWGVNAGSWEPDGALVRGDVRILRPCLSVYGAATLKDFSKNLASKEITNGLFNRFLILPRFGEVEIGEEPDGILAVPQAMSGRLKALFSCLPSDQMGLNGRGDMAPGAPIYVPFSDAADAMNSENRIFQREMMRMSDEDEALGVYGRYAEMIKRIALVVACGRRPLDLSQAVIESDDMAFAKRIVTYGTEQFVLMIRRDMVEGWVQAQYKMVLEIVRKAGLIRRRDLTRKIDGRIQKRDREAILMSLIEAENLEEVQVPPGPKGGPPAMAYRYLRG